MQPIILSREGTRPNYRWKQYLIIRDASVVILDMTPATFGWNVHCVWRQGDEAWPGHTADDILKFKMSCIDDINKRVENADEIAAVLRLEEKYKGHTGLVVRE